MDEYLKRFYRITKENVAFIAILPTSLGAIWQVSKLSFISVNMIRFFSITQLVSDGILILLVVILPLLFSILPFARTINESKKTGENIFDKNLLFFNTLTIVGLLIFMIVIIFNYQLFDYVTVNSMPNFIKYFQFAFAALVIVHFILALFLNKYKATLQFIAIFFFLVFTSLTVISFDKILKNLENVENFQILLQKIEKEDNYSRKPQILYFNDKYIFIELEKNKKKSILIKDINSLFN